MIKINLLPKKKKITPLGRELTIGVIWIILLFAGGILGYYQLKSKISNLENQITETNRQIKSTSLKVEEINKLKSDKEKVEQRLNLIKEMKTRQKGPLSLLCDISQLIPEKVWLSLLSVKGPQIIVEGVSLTENNIAFFMKNLEKTKKFSQVELEKITRANETDKIVKKFKIICNTLQPKAKSKDKEPKQEEKPKQKEGDEE